MTTANKITILRILLIPFFVVEVLYYVKDGEELHRLLAILSFAVAANVRGFDLQICDGSMDRTKIVLIPSLTKVGDFHAQQPGQRTTRPVFLSCVFHPPTP